MSSWESLPATQTHSFDELNKVAATTSDLRPQAVLSGELWGDFEVSRIDF